MKGTTAMSSGGLIGSRHCQCKVKKMREVLIFAEEVTDGKDQVNTRKGGARHTTPDTSA